jgi:hypothetical protein
LSGASSSGGGGGIDAQAMRGQAKALSLKCAALTLAGSVFDRFSLSVSHFITRFSNLYCL